MLLLLLLFFSLFPVQKFLFDVQIKGKLRCKCAKCSESVHTYSICRTHIWENACVSVFDTAACVQRLEWWQGITEQTACIQINVIGVSMKLFKALFSSLSSTYAVQLSTRFFTHILSTTTSVTSCIQLGRRPPRRNIVRTRSSCVFAVVELTGLVRNQ